MGKIHTTFVLSVLIGCSGGGGGSGSDGLGAEQGAASGADAGKKDAGGEGDPTLEADGGGEAGDDSATGDSDAAVPADASLSTCAEPSGPGKLHDTAVSVDTVWKAADSPHHVPTAGLVVAAKLTIEPCVTVLFESKAQLTVTGTKGKLEALGTETQPVTFAAEDATLPYNGISAEAGGTLALAYATIREAGFTDPAHPGAVNLRAEGTERAIGLLDHVTIRASASDGLIIDGAATLDPASTDLTITGSKGRPMVLELTAVSSLCSGTYTGNGDDSIGLPGGTVANATFHDLGIPYVVLSQASQVGLLNVDGKLVLEPGTEIRFPLDSRLVLNSGQIHAVGTEEKPIVLRGTEPLAGLWRGVAFWAVNPESRFEYVRVAHGGRTWGVFRGCPTNGFSEAAAAISIIGTATPTESFIKHCWIEHSTAHGILRAWIGTPTDFLDTNTFSDIARCHQSYPVPTTNGSAGCPNPAPCVMD